MSGGVDSSLTAMLLQEEGYEVSGMTMLLFDTYDADGNIIEPQSVVDARRVAEQLGIPHRVVDLRDRFKARVVDYFLHEYGVGRTPNPCVMCNRQVKFGGLYESAQEAGIDLVATGHYARIEQLENGTYAVRKGMDIRKDQSYALCRLTQELLAHFITPLGGLEKTETRALAKQYGLIVADKPESQEICFVPKDDYKAYLAHHAPEMLEAGDIVDLNGRVLGTHQGVPFYTIGQRKGLGIAAEHPLYVVGLDAEKKRVVVGANADLFVKGLTATDVNWQQGERTAPFEANVKIRYGNRETKSRIEPLDGGRIRVIFAEPLRAATPGQSVVMYEGDMLLGGAFIERAL
ncbi:tRNA 2-thiouridine(34) synthase MnmA [Selenomonas sp. TAMA-11512]|nr:tRNA 2-thiouridine(34) synthase MnmA [Selenomonas sp. TAMA-11512]